MAPESKLLAHDITVLMLVDDPEIYVGLDSFIEFLRKKDKDRPEDEVFTKGMLAIADFLTETKKEFTKHREEFVDAMDFASDDGKVH